MKGFGRLVAASAVVGATLAAPVAALALDSRAHVEKAIALIEAGSHSLARSYLAPALVDPRLAPGERSRAFYLRGFSFMSEGLPVSARKDFNRALEFNPDNPGALYALARLYFYGAGTDEDRSLALALFEKAAGLGHVGARFHLGYSHLHGEGVEQNVARARALFEENAAEEHAFSMLQLAASYRAPFADPPEPERAVAWYERAVAAGEGSGYLFIGYMYGSGELGEPDEAQAVRHYQLAADLEVPGAYLSLGHAYLSGAGVPVDHAAALAFYEQAAAAGVKESFIGLGHLYEAGLGVAPDRERARRLYEEGARRGDLQAQLRMTYFLLGEDDPEAVPAALEWLRMAVDQGSAQAHNDYAWLLATSRRADLRNGTLALSHARQAVELDRNPAYLDTLAAAYAENGQFPEAVETQLEAIALVPEGEPALRRELEEHLDRYQRSEPWRE